MTATSTRQSQTAAQPLAPTARRSNGVSSGGSGDPCYGDNRVYTAAHGATNRLGLIKARQRGERLRAAGVRSARGAPPRERPAQPRVDVVRDEHKLGRRRLGDPAHRHQQGDRAGRRAGRCARRCRESNARRRGSDAHCRGSDARYSRRRGARRGSEPLEQVEQRAAPGGRYAQRLAGHDHRGDGREQLGGQRRTGERRGHDQRHGRDLVGWRLRPLHDGLEAGGPAARRRQDGAAPPWAARRTFKSSMAVTGAGSTP